ncbi:copper resistance CopC family protein [Actinomadura gamaensis]|uniref:Copper resistance protein CopC n=1 Tax=Actinomadura gamaensis TaxID=1763541 RepID=A0ABV9TY92_9ACTN
MKGRLIVAGAVMAGALGVSAVPASAHTSLKSSDPAAGATVASPQKLTLTYADPVGFPQVVLTDASGGRHEAGAARAVDNVVTESVKGPLPNGVYTVGWRVVASDGHPVTGEFKFTVAGSSAAPGQAQTPPPSAFVSSAAKSSSGGGGSAGWLWVGLGVVVLALIGGGIAWTRRKRTG